MHDHDTRPRLKINDWGVVLVCLLGTLWGLIRVVTVSIKLDLTYWPF